MLGSSGEKYHISNVNIKLYDTLSINNAHLKRGEKTNYVEVKQIKSNIY